MGRPRPLLKDRQQALGITAGEHGFQRSVCQRATQLCRGGVTQAVTKLIPPAGVLRSGSQPSRIVRPLTFLDMLYIRQHQLVHVCPVHSVKRWSGNASRESLSSHNVLYYTLLALTAEERGSENGSWTDNAWRNRGQRDGARDAETGSASEWPGRRAAP